jgi:hypothetical protein
MQLYHYSNIRPHEGLEGKTPNEACKIELKCGISANPYTDCEYAGKNHLILYFIITFFLVHI